jgi:hypothetical protein
MLIECLIRRAGPTTIELGKTRYVFMPMPDPKRTSGEPSTSVCDISSEEHLEFLLKPLRIGDVLDFEKCNATQFRVYKEGQPEPKDERAVNLSGFAIVKHTEGRTEGYRIEDNRKRPKRYAGSDMAWKPDTQGLVPWNSEMEAFEWLRDEVALMDDESEDEKADKILAETKKGK